MYPLGSLNVAYPSLGTPVLIEFINNTHLHNLARKFYAGCPSCRNSLHLSGLGTGIKTHRNVPSMAGLEIGIELGDQKQDF